MILNGAFEGDASAWVQSSRWGYGFDLRLHLLRRQPATSHRRSSRLLGGTDLETAQIEQRIILPVARPRLDYWYRIESEDLCGYDTGQILAIAGDKKNGAAQL